MCFQFTQFPCDDWENMYIYIYILCLIFIIKSEVWTITHCLGLGHETMVCALCLSIFLLVSRNWIIFKRYALNRDSEGRIHCPVKMATRRFPIGSHNFAQRVFFITIGSPQLLFKPSMIPPCHICIQKLHAHRKYSPDLESIQTRCATYSYQPLSINREAIGPPRRCCLTWRHHLFTWITLPSL